MGALVPKRGWVDPAPLNTPKSTTTVASMRLNGAIARATLSGSMIGERFLAYLDETLILTLEPGAYVIMDNLGSHHVKGVEERIRAAGAIPLCLPPYSPDLTPVEKLWSKVKAILRKERVRSAELLPRAIAHAFTLIRPVDCAGWFASLAFLDIFVDCSRGGELLPETVVKDNSASFVPWVVAGFVGFAVLVIALSSEGSDKLKSRDAAVFNSQMKKDPTTWTQEDRTRFNSFWEWNIDNL